MTRPGFSLTFVMGGFLINGVLCRLVLNLSKGSYLVLTKMGGSTCDLASNKIPGLDTCLSTT